MRLPRRLGTGDNAELVVHLDELRSRLIICLVGLAGGTAIAFAFHHRLLELLNRPLPGPRRHPVTFGVAEPFSTSFKVSLYAGLALALPIILWQVWSFLAPAVAASAQRAIAAFVVAATALFGVGVAFGYGVVLPPALHFLTNYDAGVYDIQIRASDYYSFVLVVLVALGVVFELPIFILALVRLGVTSADKLRRNRRIGIVATAALAVALPGVDPVTTVFEMVPLVALFEASIWLAVWFERRRRGAPLESRFAPTT
jgi:sec-independent protein translocase protein TatC